MINYIKEVDKADEGKCGIYLIHNIENNKVYVGRSVNLWNRVNEGHIQKLKKQKSHNRYLQRAWNKYGDFSFKYYVIEYCKVDLLNDREYYWMEVYQSYKKENGYNLITDKYERGDYRVSEETRKKISESTKGEFNPFYGKTHSKEVKDKIAKRRMRSIVQLDEDGELIKEWEGISVAAKHFNVSPHAIKTVLYGKTTLGKGYVWMYAEDFYEKGFNKEEHFSRDQSKRPVVQLDLEGNFIKEWYMASKPKKDLGIHNVYNVCCGNQKTAGGYKWMFKEDYNKINKLNT